ncbi:ABC-ATPase domain-containing protein [Allostreptomyces psammosilenae]|uniref:Putative ABC-class ATPase n=1 Tax=Allostreptomyces psammosilenae TaxID=1892865 RepID=A0A852ZYM8_9ACTN|nr:ABC-ATPase domain-containing protein [Allostreptomyces psammosilenae]NYI07259.1 putative ABC-class ATPase [Allostreptomyces psammosilenae]
MRSDDRYGRGGGGPRRGAGAGAYYRERYGGGRSRREDGRAHEDPPRGADRLGSDLAAELRAMDGASYGRYKSLTGRWRLTAGAPPAVVLEIEKVQSDPFAPPSRVAVHMGPHFTEMPPELCATAVRRRALAGFLARTAAEALRGSACRVDAGRQEVLARSSCQVDADGAVTLRLGVQLPGHGRRIDGYGAERALCGELAEAVAGLRHDALDAEAARRFVESVEDTDALRRMLPSLGLVAFVADGSVLPRRSGVDDRPAAPGAVPFRSPESLRVEVELPNRGRVAGMGLPEGVTLVVGGGFHGKSTLLRALERGVYDHVPGDGRELVVSLPRTAKVRAEDGRRVEGVDVSAFVDHLPTGADTRTFRTDNASGSTSQAAALVEAVEAGARLLLIDEDTAATNLMIRDARMQALVAKDREPLTPFVDLVRSLHRDRGVSTVLVMGGSGDYIDVADRVVMMDAFRPLDVTARARELAAVPTGRAVEADVFPEVGSRVPDPRSVDPVVRGRRKIRAHGRDALGFGEQDIDLRAVEQLADAGQVTGIGLALDRLVRAGHLDGRRTLAEALDLLEAELSVEPAVEPAAEPAVEAEGDGPVEAEPVGALRGGYPGDFAVPRRLDVAAALNRLRSLRVID